MASPPSLWGIELNESPHGKLLQISMKHLELIDAAYANLAQYNYKVKEDKLWNQTINLEEPGKVTQPNQNYFVSPSISGSVRAKRGI